MHMTEQLAGVYWGMIECKRKWKLQRYNNLGLVGFGVRGNGREHGNYCTGETNGKDHGKRIGT